MAAPTLTPTAIRADLVTRLKAAATAAGSRVYDSREINWENDELPAVAVATLGGSEDSWGMGGRIAHRTERVAVVGTVKDTAQSDTAEAVVAAAIDSLEGEILDALGGSEEWIGAFEVVEKMDSQKAVDVSSNWIVGSLAIAFDLRYSVKYTTLPAPVSFDRTAIDTDTTDPDGADVSERVINNDGTPTVP